VVANFHLNGPYTEFEMAPFLKSTYHDCLILLDEAYVYLESRTSMRQSNRLMSYVLFQSRKKNVSIYLTVQLASSVDVRFRSLADYVITAENLGIGFEYTLGRPNDPSTVTTALLPLEKALPFFAYYDTNEVIDNTNESFEYLTPQEQIDAVMPVVSAIIADWVNTYNAAHPHRDLKSKPKPPTKAYVTIWLMQHEQSYRGKRFLTVVWDYLKASY